MPRNKETGFQRESRVKGFSYILTTVMSGIAMLLIINQVFQLELAGFLPITNAYYYYFLMFYLALD